MSAPVCDSCRARQDAWRDARIQDLLPGLGYITQASAVGDYTPAGIAADCARDRHVVPVQLELSLSEVMA